MSWKEKAIKYCMKCQNNNRLYCSYYGEWQNKRTIKNCEFIQTMEEEENDNSKDNNDGDSEEL